MTFIFIFLQKKAVRSRPPGPPAVPGVFATFLYQFPYLHVMITFHLEHPPTIHPMGGVFLYLFYHFLRWQSRLGKGAEK